MKKLLVLLVVGLLAVTSLTGCAAPKTYKFGTGSYTTIKSSAAVAAVEATKDAAAVEAADGKVQVTTVYAAVLLDDAGKVVYVDIDAAQNQGTFDATGAVVKAEAAPTKTEKGADYGMASASAIGKEWFEQMAALEAYFVGKTTAEVEATEMDEEDVTDAAVAKSANCDRFDAYSADGAEASDDKADVKAVDLRSVEEVGYGSLTQVTGRAVK